MFFFFLTDIYITLNSLKAFLQFSVSYLALLFLSFLFTVEILACLLFLDLNYSGILIPLKLLPGTLTVEQAISQSARGNKIPLC